MMRIPAILTVVAICTASLICGKISALTFKDSFEGDALNSGWATSENHGMIAFPSSGQVHSGQQSLQLSSDGGDVSNIQLTYSLPTLGYGKAEVWYYDTGADIVSSRYGQMRIGDSTNANVGAYINAWDYDLELGNGGSYVFGVDGSVNFQHSLIDRTQAWHHWVLDSQAAGLKISIDDTVVYSGPGIRFDEVSLSQYGPAFRPAWTAYFDDFQVEQVPEPATLMLLLPGTLFAIWRIKQ